MIPAAVLVKSNDRNKVHIYVDVTKTRNILKKDSQMNRGDFFEKHPCIIVALF